MKRLLPALALATLALVAAACSSSAPTPGHPSPAPSSPAGSPGSEPGPAVIAKDLKFDRTELEVPAGRPFTLVFDNQEGPPHNVAIYSDESASQKLFVGEIFSGPAVKSYTVPALPAGTWFFRCDVHPEMKGSVVAG